MTVLRCGRSRWMPACAGMTIVRTHALDARLRGHGGPPPRPLALDARLRGHDGGVATLRQRESTRPPSFPRRRHSRAGGNPEGSVIAVPPYPPLRTNLEHHR